MPTVDRLIKRQQVLADFGDFALDSDNLDEVLTEACRLVSEALETSRAKVLEIQEDGHWLFARAGVGWGADVIGRLRLPMHERSSETFSVAAGQPVVTKDVREERRFEIAQFMRDAGVVAMANVPIFLPGRRAYGLLQVDASEPRDFGADDINFLRTYSSILGPVIDRLRIARDLRATEERFRLTVASARDYAIFVSDPQDRITDWLAGAAAIFGWSAEEIVGKSASVLFTTEDQNEKQDVREVETARLHGVAPNVRWHSCKDGSRVFIEGTVRALRDADGHLLGFLKIGQDVTERRRAEERLRESEERFRQFAEASSDVIWIRDAKTLQMEYLSPAFQPVYGENREEFLNGDTFAHWARLLHPSDRAVACANIDRVREGERMTHEFRIVRPSDGEIRWIRNTDFPLFNPAGRVKRIGGMAEDVTEQKASATRLEVLVAELQHRSRNVLAVVSSIASKTLGQVDAFESFQTRLYALSRAQGLLSQSGSDTVEVGALVRAELAAHIENGSSKIVITGPKVHLTARQVQNFALAVHELATNAVKYGALRGGAGRLFLTWKVRTDSVGARFLDLTWVESEVNIQLDKATRRGYGRELIENALSYALRAKTEFALEASGVRCRIELPLG